MLQSLLLSLSVLGHPEPDITWYKNGVEIESEDGSLQLPVISLDDEGVKNYHSFGGIF